MISAPHIALFDLYTGGHHLSYLQQAVEAWLRRDEPGRLTVCASGKLFDSAPEWAAWLDSDETPRLTRWIAPESGLQHDPGGLFQVLANDRVHGSVLRRVVQELHPDRVILMMADHVQASLATGLRFSSPVRFRGILFRPSFHYRSVFGSPTSRLFDFRKRWLLKAASLNPHMEEWLPLDPYVIPTLQKLAPRTLACHLPDAFDPSSRGATPESFRESWSASREDTVALLFGVIGERKGVFEVLQALPHLSEDRRRRLVLVLAGRIALREKSAVLKAVRSAQAETGVRIVVTNEYLPDDLIQDAIASSDLTLVAYRHHVGSSGVLIRAAAAGVPVVAQRWGLMGRYVADRRLGLAVDPGNAPALASAIEHAAARTMTPDEWDPVEATRFASEHSLAHFGQALFGECDQPAASR